MIPYYPQVSAAANIATVATVTVTCGPIELDVPRVVAPPLATRCPVSYNSARIARMGA